MQRCQYCTVNTAALINTALINTAHVTLTSHSPECWPMPLPRLSARANAGHLRVTQCCAEHAVACQALHLQDRVCKDGRAISSQR